MKDDMVVLPSARVLEIRTRLKLSQRGLGLRIGVAAETVYAWEKGISPCQGPAARYLLLLELAGPVPGEKASRKGKR